MKLLHLTTALLALASITGVTSVQAAEAAATKIELYQIDTAHSSVKFSIRHFVAKTTGSFSDFSGTLTINRDDLTQSSIEAQIQLPSVDTDSEKRDVHLQQDDYFETSLYPLMTFQSTHWAATDSENNYKVTGDLSIRGQTHPVTLDVELLGFGEGNRGAFLSGWEATATLDRTLWGIDGGQPVVGTDVDILINIEAVRQ
jgi:polyisoprenoid-binding protein YceI